MTHWLRRVWIAACILMLPIGLALASFGYLPNDVGLGMLWFPVMLLLVVPLGSVAYLVYFIVLALVERSLLGEGNHFSPVADVCLSWAVMFYFGYIQWFGKRRLFGRKSEPPNPAVNTDAPKAARPLP